MDHEILTFQKMGIRRVQAMILLPKAIGCFAVGVFAGVIVLAAALLFPIYHDVQIASIVVT